MLDNDFCALISRIVYVQDREECYLECQFRQILYIFFFPLEIIPYINLCDEIKHYY